MTTRMSQKIPARNAKHNSDISKADFYLPLKDIIKKTSSLQSKTSQRFSRSMASPKYVPTAQVPLSIAAVQGYTRLSYWLIKLTIDSVYSDPVTPDLNGRTQGVHRYLKTACLLTLTFYLPTLQCSLNRFPQEYHHISPKNALAMKTPSYCHDFSNRP
jgi:hypothetical protein